MSDELAPDLAPGEPGTGGWFATWPRDTPDGTVAERIGFQYPGMAHQATTATDGMWLLLASELLFFGGLFLLYMVYRLHHPAAFAAASRHAELWIGTVNTVLLATSSAVLTWGIGRLRQGDARRLSTACTAVAGLGCAFLALKGWEWHLDLDANLFPGPGFAMTGALAQGAQLFWGFYFAATALHGLHMVVGIGLLAWLALRARRGALSQGYQHPAEVVGLYWSFVDMVWLCLYPMLYLVDRT